MATCPNCKSETALMEPALIVCVDGCRNKYRVRDDIRNSALEEAARVAKSVPHLPARHKDQTASCDCPEDEGGADTWCQKAVDAVCCMREQVVDAILKLKS